MNYSLFLVKESHIWIYLQPWVISVIMIIIFAFGFAFGWIRGGIATLYFFIVNFIAIIILNLLNIPFKNWLLSDVSIFHYTNWVIYRLFAPLILIIGGLAIVNASAWIAYILIIRKYAKNFEKQLSPKRKKVSIILGAFISGSTWVYIGMMPVFSLIPITENSKKIQDSVVGRTLDTFYNPLPIYKDFQIIEQYKDFFVKTYNESQDKLAHEDTLVKKVSVLLNYLLDQLELNPTLFGSLDAITKKTIAEIKEQISDFLLNEKNPSAEKVKEFVNKTTEQIRKFSGLPITTNLIYGYINGVLL